MKNRYGITPWGAWFIDVLDSYSMGARLDRGRTYANTGRVLSLAFNGGSALAKVEGRSYPSYRVEIIFPPLKEAERVYQIIENDPPLLASIASGELPQTFLSRLKKGGIDLIPRRWEEMERSCSCPDYGDPCKHMAALYYIIAREIDADPHLLFRLRGMDIEARFGKAALHVVAKPFTVTYASTQKSAGKKTQAEEAPQETPLALEEIPHCAELITALLPAAPPFSAKDFALVMAEFYHRCAENQFRESAEAETNAEMEQTFSRSVWTVVCPKPAPGAKVFLDMNDINGNVRRFTPCSAFDYFTYFSSEDGTASYRFLFYLFKFLNIVCSSGAFIPYVLADKNNLEIIWRPFETLPPVCAMLEKIALHEPGMLAAKKPVSGRSVVDIIASAFLNEWVNRNVTEFSGSFNKHGTTDESRELLGLFFHGKHIDVSSPVLHGFPALIDRWLAVLHIDFTAFKYSLTIKEARIDRKNPPFGFSLSIDVHTEDSKKIPLSKCTDIKMLRAPTALSNYLPEIRDLGKHTSIALSEERLIDFMDSAASLLTRLGMAVTLPKSLAKELKPRLVVKGSSKSGSLKTYLNLESLLNFEWQIAIGDKVLSLAEFKKLLKEKRAMVRFRDGFVKMDVDAFSRLLKKAHDTSPTFTDFLKAHFSGDSVLAFDAQKTIENLFREQDLPVPADLNAELRPYQKRGYNWICSLLFSGFGCILADDMGLGKTVQSIATILRLKEEGLLRNEDDGYGCLIVAPAALLDNWEKELSRFAPSLSVSRYHGQKRALNRKHDVFLTTYQTAVRDAKKFKEIAFSLLLVDEAHLMKNNETRLSKTVKLLCSKYRLALSGTPVENRLEDLRSLFDFILPGYLGDAADFRNEYRIPIEVMRNGEKAEALRKITSPFLLRRLKTDKTIIGDLPEKIVSNEYAVLGKEQAALYESVVSQSLLKSEQSDPQQRPALVLSLLTSLKQICNHPRVFDKESPAVSELSGKAQLLLALLGEILANREKTLVFSQYIETLDCLQRIIKNELGEAPLLYHGGLSQKIRTETISQFQNNTAARILLVSLKAGGLGLNLTAASRVIHYDLWYNPSVENQATDRAFRIGQKRTVFVHRLITKNSFEEKIDAMLSSKQEIADMTVKSGESWLAGMNHAELKALFDR